jgi:hypothetical protein
LPLALNKETAVANCIYKDCDRCGRKIRLAEMDNGQWLPFEMNGSGLHRCCSRSRTALRSVTASPEMRLADVLESAHVTHRDTVVAISDSRTGRWPPLAGLAMLAILVALGWQLIEICFRLFTGEI